MTTRSTINLLGGICCGAAIALSLGASAAEGTIYAKDVMLEAISGLEAKNVRAALEELLDSKIEASDIADFAKKVKAAMGDKADDNPLNHDRYTDSEARTAAMALIGKKGDDNPRNHQRYGEADVKASATIKALQAEQTTLKKTLADLKSKLQASSSTLSLQCPAGYSLTSTAGKTPVVCKRGKDEMVQVGSFWIDRYETTIVDSAYFNGGKCNGTSGKRYGFDGVTSPGKNYPSSFPESGAWTGSAPLAACSISAIQPSRSATWFQFAQACAAAGKHLCTNAEWQAAAAGTPDSSTSCNVSSTATEKTGARSGCISSWGAYDMVGNLWEYVAWWNVAGNTWMTSTTSEQKAPWPTSYGDGKDGSWSVNGEAYDASDKFVKGMPAAALRGGSHNDGVEAGVFAVNLVAGPVWWAPRAGGRCCRRRR